MPKTARSRLKSCHWHDLPELTFRRLSPITAQGSTTSFEYGTDGERLKKVGTSATTWYVGNDGELKGEARRNAVPANHASGMI